MSHVRRLRLSDRIFFVTVNLRRTLAPFSATEYEQVASAMSESRRKLGFLFLGYVLMPDHWHALIWPTFPLTISRVVQDVKWLSVNQGRHTSGAVWQHQFWDRFVRHAQEFRERLDYMHLNPVRKGLVKRPGEWPWSSYNPRLSFPQLRRSGNQRWPSSAALALNHEMRLSGYHRLR